MPDNNAGHIIEMPISFTGLKVKKIEMPKVAFFFVSKQGDKALADSMGRFLAFSHRKDQQIFFDEFNSCVDLSDLDQLCYHTGGLEKLTGEIKPILIMDFKANSCEVQLAH